MAEKVRVCRRRDLKKICDCKVIVNECKAASYSGMQIGLHGKKENGRESKATYKMMETKGD